MIDEVQKAPALLDEVHWLIENRSVVFALYGSSARKVRRGHANLLGGRALRYELHGLVSLEVGDEYDVVRVVNHLARRGTLALGTELIGAAFENWVFHQLAAYRAYRRPSLQLSFWRLAGGTEVDFVVDEFHLAREAKATRRVHADHLKGLREVAADHRVHRRAIVSFDERPRRTDDGIDVLPWRTFAERLWADDLIAA